MNFRQFKILEQQIAQRIFKKLLELNVRKSEEFIVELGYYCNQSQRFIAYYLRKLLKTIPVVLTGRGAR